MKRLLRIAFDQALLSLIPVISWFMLSLLIDKNLINVFTLTYPIQFIWYICVSVFSTSTNIGQAKENNKNSTMSGILLGTIISFIIFSILLLNIDNYITFMNMDISIYRNFTIYTIIQIFIQLILMFYIEKLYFEEKNKLANKYSLIFNLLNFISLIGTTIIFKNQFYIISITLSIIFIYTIIIAIKESNKFKLDLSIFKFIKYDSVELFSVIAFFFIYLFGLSKVFEYGASYATALTFIALITDTQWDVLGAVKILAKVDIAKNNFNYKIHKRNAYKLLMILFSSSFIMFILLYKSYNLNLYITSFFILVEIICMSIYPLYKIKTYYLQLEYSAAKTTTNKVFSDIIRVSCSFFETPFCTAIGQISSAFFQLLTYNYIFYKNYKINLDGSIKKRLD